MAIFGGKVKESAVSQSVVGRANAEKKNGLIGMLQNPYVFLTCLFASLGCMMYGYDQGVMGAYSLSRNSVPADMRSIFRAGQDAQNIEFVLPPMASETSELLRYVCRAPCFS
jgi:hypothetical protein